MRVHAPSAGTVLGGIALVIALSGTALAATGQLVNVADPENASNLARVGADGALRVGDGNDRLTVDGTVGVKDSHAGPLTVTEQLAQPFNARLTVSSVVDGASSCSAPTFTLPAGETLLIERAVVDYSLVRASQGPKASIRLIHLGDDMRTTHIDVPVPLRDESGLATAGGAVDIGAIVRPNELADAARGDIYQVGVCLNRGSAATASPANVLLIGKR